MSTPLSPPSPPPPETPRLPTRVSTWIRQFGLTGAVCALVVFVAGTAFALSYGGTAGTSRDAGMSAAGWLPLCLEGAVIICAIALAVLRVHPKMTPEQKAWIRGGRRLAWSMLSVGTVLSAASNLVHAYENVSKDWSKDHGLLPTSVADWTALALSLVPPLALPPCALLAERIIMHFQWLIRAAQETETRRVETRRETPKRKPEPKPSPRPRAVPETPGDTRGETPPERFACSCGDIVARSTRYKPAHRGHTQKLLKDAA